MPRITVNIEGFVLRDLRRLQKEQKKPLGRLISELLAEALSHAKSDRASKPRFRWVSRPMGARIDLTDKEALRVPLEGEREQGP